MELKLKAKNDLSALFRFIYNLKKTLQNTKIPLAAIQAILINLYLKSQLWRHHILTK